MNLLVQSLVKLRNIYFDLSSKWLIKQPHVGGVYLWDPGAVSPSLEQTHHQSCIP